MAVVETVTGPVDAHALGITLPHEHLFLDLTCLWQPPRDPGRAWLVDAPVSRDQFETLAQDPYHSRDNLRLDSAEVVAEELRRFRHRQGGTVVDLSSATIGPYPEELRELSNRTGVHIVASTGFYVRRAHPPWVHAASVAEVADHLLTELTVGIKGTSVRAGIIGEIGTSSPVHPDELKVLKAAAWVQRQHPIGLNVHLSIFAAEGLTVLKALEEYGADLSRVVLSHVDENLSPTYHRALAERGAFLEFDTFGSECCFAEDQLHEPSDAERLAGLLRLADQGYLRQVLISQDVCTKMQWHQNGGRGYDHVLQTIVPQLRAAGLTKREIGQVLVGNPAVMLSGEAISSE